jgi:serine/threonine protein kinase
MNDPLDNMNTMLRGPSYDTIGDMLTQRPNEAIVLAGRYRVVRKLGEGGMGSVWLAEDTKLDGRQVAIKMLPVVLVANKRAIQQLKAEAKVAIQLAHPNIATLRGFEEAQEGPFLVIDYIQGATLEDTLADCGTLSVDEVIRLFTPIAQALDYAHTQRVVHRDIKPSNILIREDGVPFITDFGIAREMKDTMTRVTGRSTSGTLPYMSPEQLRGESPTPQQDIYSLAATLYECLAGHPPFYRGQIEYQVMRETPEPLTTSLWPSIQPGLSKNPKARPAHATALLELSSSVPPRTALLAPTEESRLPRPHENKPEYPQPPPKEKTSALALACLGLAAISTMLGPITGVPSIIMGHLARHRIQNATVPIQGGGEAKGGLILSYIMSIAWTVIWLVMLMK